MKRRNAEVRSEIAQFSASGKLRNEKRRKKRKYFYGYSCNFEKYCDDQTKLHFKLPDTAEDLSDLVNLAKYSIVNFYARHHSNLLF